MDRRQFIQRGLGAASTWALARYTSEGDVTPTISLTPNPSVPDATVTVTGVNYGRRVHYTIKVDNVQVASGTTSSTGHITATITADSSPGDYTVLVSGPVRSASATLTVEGASEDPDPAPPVSCDDTSGIEKKFPCSPLVIGAMAVSPGANAWAEWVNTTYQGENDANSVNEAFSAVRDPLNVNAVVIRNINRLGDTEKHTTVGTADDVAKGATVYCAFDWLWLNPTEFKPVGWSLIWQLQMIGSPTAAISVDKSTGRWFLKSRNGADAGINYDLGPVLYGRRAFFVVGVTNDDSPDGMVEAWFAHDDWPDVTQDPKAHRDGHQTYQGQAGRNTMGIYAEHFAGSTARYTGYFSKFGRAATAARAIEIAR